MGHSDCHDHVIDVHDHCNQNEKGKKQGEEEKGNGVVRNHQDKKVEKGMGDPHENLEIKRERKREKVRNYLYILRSQFQRGLTFLISFNAQIKTLYFACVRDLKVRSTTKLLSDIVSHSLSYVFGCKFDPNTSV